MSSTLTSKAPEFLCPKHPTQTIHSLCLHTSCEAPYICNLCESTHRRDHSESFQTMKRIYSDKVLTQYAKALNCDFSLQKIGLAKEKIFSILGDIENEFKDIIFQITKIIEESFDGLKAEVERRQSALKNLQQMKDNTLKDDVDITDLRKLAESYLIVKQDYTKSLDINLEYLSSSFKHKVIPILEKTKNELLSIFKTNMNFESPDFSKLEIQEKCRIPWSDGVGHEALAYIAKWNVLAFGCKDDQTHSVGLYDLGTKQILAGVRGAHKGWISTVVWIDHRNYLVTGSHDSTIRMFKAFNQGQNLQAVHMFQGHRQSVRCLRYVENEKLLVSGGEDADIKLWNVDNFKRCGTISTNSIGNMDGSIAYIAADRLVGLTFMKTFIRFYHLLKKNIVFQLYLDSFYRGHCGLQYLPKKRMIITKTSKAEFRTREYVEGEKKISIKDFIQTIYRPGCTLVSKDESQILFQIDIPRNAQYLSTHTLDTGVITYLILPGSEISRVSSLISLGTRGVLAGSHQSGLIYILNSRKAYNK